MFFVLLFLILAASASYVFPEYSGLSILLVSLGCVATLRILLALTARSGKKPTQTE